MADLKNTITAGNTKLWNFDLLPFYPNGTSLKYGPNASDVYTADNYPLVNTFNETHVPDDEFTIVSGEGGQFLWDYTKLVDGDLPQFKLDVNENYVSRTFKINGYDFLSKTSFNLNKSDIGLSNVPNYGFEVDGNSDTKFASTSYVHSKSNWVNSANGNPIGSVVQYTKQLDNPIDVIITGGMTATQSNWDGRTNIALNLTPNISPKLTLNGDVSGSATFTNLGNAVLTAVVANNSHTHVSANITDATPNNTANMIVMRNASGNFSAGTITAALNGNANTATILKTARTINGTTFDGSANITTANWGTPRTLTIGNKATAVNGSVNVSWTLSDIGAAASIRTISTGDGLSGGGNLTANRTFSVDNTVVRTDGNQTLNDVKTFSTNPISTAEQSLDVNALTKKGYIDDLITGIKLVGELA